MANDATAPAPKEIDMGEFTFAGLTATSEARREDVSVWILRLDPDAPDTMYVTWKQKDGTKKLDDVKFRRKR